jgi:von Willebrand factor type A C-terminal domain
MNPPEFTVTTSQNEYLPGGGRDAHAVITVTSAGVPDCPAKLGRAVALAHEHGREDTARLLARVIDVVDPVTGTVGSSRRSGTWTR